MSPSHHAIRGSIGAALRAERQRRHISLDAVARGTLVRQDFLELIDADRLEELPTGAYGKGFIRSYVAYLGLDPKPFLAAYDKRCGRPEPELSPLVTRGIRVPPRAQRRGWQIAVGSTAVLIILLLAFGAFRSGDEAADLPQIGGATAARARSSVPNTTEAVVRIEVIAEETWVEAEVDGQHAFGAILQRGDYEDFKGAETVALYIARAQAVRITANGQILGTPEDGSFRGVFRRDTTQMPANEWKAANLGQTTPSDPAEEPDSAQVAGSP